MDVAREKRAAAEAAASLVTDGMAVGLGTGTTVAFLLDALGRRKADVRCVATSPRTESAARAVGLRVERFGALDALDLAIDGADQVSSERWLVKGGGGALTREKVVAASASRFVVIVDSTKLVERLHPPVPVEVLAFGLAATLRHLAPCTRRDAPRTPDGGVLADYQGAVDEPQVLAATLSATPGVVEHGLFEPGLVTTVLVGRGDEATELDPGRST